MNKPLLTFPLTLVAAAVLSTFPISMSSTVSEAKEISLAQKQGCDTNAKVCGMLACQGRNPTTGTPIKGAQGFSGAALERCLSDCGKKHDACVKTGSWKNKVIGGAGGTDVKTKPGGVATVPKTPGKHSSGTLSNGSGGGVVTQPKSSSQSPPIGTYHPRQPFGTTGAAGTYHSGGSPQGGAILRSSSRR